MGLLLSFRARGACVILFSRGLPLHPEHGAEQWRGIGVDRRVEKVLAYGVDETGGLLGEAFEGVGEAGRGKVVFVQGKGKEHGARRAIQAQMPPARPTPKRLASSRNSYTFGETSAGRRPTLQ